VASDRYPTYRVPPGRKNGPAQTPRGRYNLHGHTDEETSVQIEAFDRVPRRKFNAAPPHPHGGPLRLIVPMPLANFPGYPATCGIPG